MSINNLKIISGNKTLLLAERFTTLGDMAVLMIAFNPVASLREQNCVLIRETANLHKEINIRFVII